MYSKLPIKIITKRVIPSDPRFSVTHRQELIAGFAQQIFSNSRADFIGAGGIGSEVAEGVCRKGPKEVNFFDHDPVDQTNLNRQHFFARDVGKNKAHCLAANLAPHCHAGTILAGYPFSFEDALALNVDMSATFVVCGVDNNATRVMVSRYYRKLSVPVVFIAVDMLAECGHVFVQETGTAAPCFGCAFPKSLTPRKAPCFVPSSKDILKVVAGLGLYAADSLLMERKRNWNYRRIHLAGYAPDVSLNVERNATCPLCSEQQQGSPVHPQGANRAFAGSCSPYPS